MTSGTSGTSETSGNGGVAASMHRTLTGTVERFDREIGLGEVRAADGTIYPFHCIVIADGTRSVEVGASVAFELLPKLGRWEATALRPA